MSSTTSAIPERDSLWREIRENHLHPHGWVNPVAKGKYNLVVIGGGTAGLVTAAAAGMLGARVALIESHFLGGDCTNYGCVPSKALLASARAAAAVRDAARYGITSASPATDYLRVVDRLERLRAQIAANDSAKRFQGFGADVFFGEARFENRNCLRINDQKLQFHKAVIATGTSPAIPEIAHLQETGYLTNETVFSLERLPRHLVVIGGGPIGCELGQAFRRLGSEVTIVTRGARLLPRDDPDASAILLRRFQEEGIQVLLNATPIAVLGNQGEHTAGKLLTVKSGAGEQRLACDRILIAAGRKPNLDALNLAAAGVRADARGVLVDDRLRTHNHSIFAAGDVCSRFQFTHAAEAMARLVVQNALFGARRRVSNLVIPWCTYTDPEIAHAGITAGDVQASPRRYLTYTKDLKDTDRAILDGNSEGFARIHVERRGGRVAGASFVSTSAGEAIAEMVLAIQQDLTVGDLSAVIHPYPTVAEAFKRAADQHLQSRLRPWMKPLLRRYFSWRRG